MFEKLDGPKFGVQKQFAIVISSLKNIFFQMLERSALGHTSQLPLLNVGEEQWK